MVREGLKGLKKFLRSFAQSRISLQFVSRKPPPLIAKVGVSQAQTPFTASKGGVDFNPPPQNVAQGIFQHQFPSMILNLELVVSLARALSS